MKSTFCAVICASLFLAAAPVVAQTGNDLFQQALVKERADGDLRGAIEIYERIAREFTADRTLAAKALVQLGQCYEKLGSTEAERAYQRVVSEFADQSAIVAQARSRLAALQRAARASEAATITTRRVSSGYDVGGHDVTPDGRYLVWNDYQKTMNLDVREIASGERRLLTQDARFVPTSAHAYDGRVSPDGQWVAHGYAEDYQGGSLRVVGMDGEGLRVVLREYGCWIRPYEWTSDGQHIAARRACWSEADQEWIHQIVMVSVSDGSTRVVHDLPGTEHALRSWLSPDDGYLVYDGPVAEDGGNADIWLLPVGGGGEVNVIQHPADDRLLGWVPGTNQILFLSDRDGTWDLWGVSFGDGGVAGPPVKLQRDMGKVEAVGFSENGSFFYSVFTRWFNLIVAPFDPATGMPDMAAATPLLGSNRHAQWSPDGQYLAFVTESELTEGKAGRLNVRHLPTGEQRELVPHLRVRFVGDWSPDGRTVLVIGADDTQEDPRYRVGIYAVDVSNGETTPLLPLQGRQDAWAEWSLDGESILYSLVSRDSARAPAARIMRRHLNSGEEWELYRDSLINPRVELSSDGRQLVFAFEDSVSAVTRGGLAILDIERGVARRIVTHGDSVNGEPGSVQWTPDNRYVLYAEIVHGDEWRTNVWRVAAAGGAPEYLWTAGEGKYGSWFELSPDGRRIALTTYTQENEIWVMENLKEVLERER
jgi:Tol biopolymer transport system component